MRLTWMGTAALLLETEAGTVAFDPFPGLPVGAIRRPREPLPGAERFRRAGEIFVTHGHFDHIQAIPVLYREGSARVWATETPCRTLEGEGFDPGRLVRIGPGWRGKVCGLEILALQGRHCRFDGGIIAKTVLRRRFFAHPGHLLRLLRLNLRFRENGETLFFQVSRGGTRLQIMGSLGLDPGTDYPQGADALALPYQGRSDLEDRAMEILRRLRPRAVYLDHWDDAFPPMSSQVPTAGICRRAEEELGIPCRALTKGETVKLRPPFMA